VVSKVLLEVFTEFSMSVFENIKNVDIMKKVRKR